MFHLSLVLENNLESPRLKRAVFGLTAPSWWTHDALKDWSRESRRACLSEHEKEIYTARRQKPKHQFDKLRTVEDGRRDPVLRLQTIKDLQGGIEGCSRPLLSVLLILLGYFCWRQILHSLGLLGVQLAEEGTGELLEREMRLELLKRKIDESRAGELVSASRAISFPQIIARNRCFVCRASTKWRMIEEDPVQSPEDKEIMDVWKPYAGTSAELACAEVETDVQFDRLC